MKVSGLKVFWGLGYGGVFIWGLAFGFRVEGLGFRCWGLRVQGLVFGIWGSGLRIWDLAVGAIKGMGFRV